MFLQIEKTWQDFNILLDILLSRYSKRLEEIW